MTNPPLDTNKGEPMKTLPEILGDSSSEWCGCYEGDMDDRFPEMKAEAIGAIAKELMGCLPEKYEVFDGVQTTEQSFRNQGYNQALDEVRARLTAFIGKEK